LVSDGVHDNLDPQNLGLNPKDLSLDYASWPDVPLDEGTTAKTKAMNEKFTQLIIDCDQAVTSSLICKKSIRYCRQITATSRQWMEQNPSGILESNYVKYPGKLDHCTCVCFQVGTYIPGKDEVAVSTLNQARWPFS